MAYLREHEVRAAADAVSRSTPLRKSATRIIEEARVADERRTSFDIFLSHAIRDKELVLGAKAILERSGRTVYVDWIVDDDLDRAQVSGATADRLRRRMDQCSALFYLHSRSSQTSRWMPWELGFFDGSNGNVAILPIVPDSGSKEFMNEEYLQLYPKVDLTGLTLSAPTVWINQSRGLETGSYKGFASWVSGGDKLRPSK
jgi:hypothetical protein